MLVPLLRFIRFQNYHPPSVHDHNHHHIDLLCIIGVVLFVLLPGAGFQPSRGSGDSKSRLQELTMSFFAHRKFPTYTTEIDNSLGFTATVTVKDETFKGMQHSRAYLATIVEQILVLGIFTR